MRDFIFEKIADAMVDAGVPNQKAQRVTYHVASRRNRAHNWKRRWQAGAITDTERDAKGNLLATNLQTFLIKEGFNAVTVVYQPLATSILLITHPALPGGSLAI